jgi:hypothetical protein
MEEPMKKTELTDDDLDRQDAVDYAIETMLCDILGVDYETLEKMADERDVQVIELRCRVRDYLEEMLVEEYKFMGNQEFYPFMEC